MKVLYKILALVIGITLTVVMQSRGQNLPSACVGTVERYWVKGFNGISDFTWQITDPDGSIVPTSAYTLIGRGDTIEITWGDSFKGGIYTFNIVETTDYGCTGAPYQQDIVLNSPEIFIPFNSLPETVEICFGNIATLDPGTGYLDYLWQDGSTDQLYITGEAGTYRVRLVDSEQSCSFDSTLVSINPLPTIDLGKDTFLLGNQTLLLDAYNPDFNFYSWTKYNFNTGNWETNPFSITSSVVVEGSGGKQWLSVLVEDLHGCENSDSILIEAGDYSNLNIPAAFTPNGDGKNDTWIFPYSESEDGVRSDISSILTDVSIRVYNRYGALVWESTGPFKAWDGKDLGGRELPMDSYHYVIRINTSSKTYVYKGSITIVK